MTIVSISLPTQIAKKVDTEARKSGFASRSEFIRSLLRRYLYEEKVQFEEFKPISLKQVKLELAKTGKYSEKFIESVTQGLAKSSQYES